MSNAAPQGTPQSTPPAPERSVQSAVARLRTPLAIIAALALLGVVLAAWLTHASLASAAVAVATPPGLILIQILALSRATRPGANGIAWIAGAYPLSILCLIVGLYVPKFFGVDVRLGAIFAIAAILAVMVAQVLVLSRARVLTVSAISSTDA